MFWYNFYHLVTCEYSFRNELNKNTMHLIDLFYEYGHRAYSVSALNHDDM